MANGKRGSALFKAAALSLLLVPGVSVPVSAQSIEDLKQQLQALQKRIEALEAKQKAEQAQKSAPSKKATPVVKKAGPGFGLATEDGLFEIDLRGRLLVDGAWGSDDDGSMDLKATELRAARLGIDGTAWKTLSYRLEADFAGDKVAMADAYLAYKGLGGTVMVGHFKPSVSLDELTSSLHAAFMERAAFTDAFNFARGIGVAYNRHGDVWSMTAGVFRGTNASNLTDEGYKVAARFTYGGKVGGTTWLAGSSVRFQDVGDGGAIRYRQRAHQHLSDRFLDTGGIASRDRFIGLEAAMQSGPVHVSSELGFLTAFGGGSQGRDAHFYGGYVEAGWFVTGEARPLKLAKGVWDRVQVLRPVHEGGPGAWQLAARFDRLDLTADGVYGGEQDTYLLGLNWYLNNNARFMLNYSHNRISKAFNVSLNGVDGANTVNTVGVRAQVDW